ncbi:MAG: oxidoreductase [Lentisphaerae bacterium GWF2_45_14]|nr:MAG: oxidoreductase [Lentisphaerae bacterium GWF2_45_14]
MLFDKFMIEKKVCVITGGTGLLGKRHVEAVLEGRGIPVIISKTQSKLEETKRIFTDKYHLPIEIFSADITRRKELEDIKNILVEKYGHIDILINNAANNPKVEASSANMQPLHFTDFPLELWEKDIAVGLTGAFLCCQVFGAVMEKQRCGVILNISSDYGILAPDQRLYRVEGIPDEMQKIKPVTYSVVKHAIGGLTKYLATYWGDKGIRVNTLCPSGIYDHQDKTFVEKFVKNVPMGRMSLPEEYLGTILYMVSDASSFLNGATIVIDGGKSIW